MGFGSLRVSSIGLPQQHIADWHVNGCFVVVRMARVASVALLVAPCHLPLEWKVKDQHSVVGSWRGCNRFPLTFSGANQGRFRRKLLFDGFEEFIAEDCRCLQINVVELEGLGLDINIHSSQTTHAVHWIHTYRCFLQVLSAHVAPVHCLS